MVLFVLLSFPPNSRHLSLVLLNSQHTHFEEIILDQENLRGVFTTSVGLIGVRERLGGMAGNGEEEEE